MSNLLPVSRQLFTLVGALAIGLFCCTAHAQTLYVLNQGDNSISKISPTGVVNNTAPNGSKEPAEGIAVDAGGNLYVSYDDNTISKFDSDGNTLSFTLTGDSLNGPGGLTVDPLGNLYVANNGNNTVSKITTSGVVSTFATGNGLNQPFHLAFDASDNLYVTNLLGHSISKFDSAGGALSFPALTGATVGALSGIAFDNQGGLYVTNGNFSNHDLLKIGDTGVATIFGTLTTSDVLGGLAIDPSGNFYTAAAIGNTIGKFDSAGNQVPFALSGNTLNGPVDLAFAPITVAVPEPGACCLLTMGLLPLGCVVLRRRICTRFGPPCPHHPQVGTRG